MQIRVHYTQPGGHPEIRVFEIEEYLRGVVPSESFDRWPLEALKAQAVASRTYAMRKALTRRNPDPGYDVIAGAVDQVWKPATSPRADQAIAATRGVVMQFNNTLASVFFFTGSIGHTESNTVVFGSPELPYLRGVACPGVPEDLSNEEAFRAFLSENPPAVYDALPGNNRMRWSVTLSRTQLEQRLAASPAVTHTLGGQLGKLKDMRVILRGRSGMVGQLEISGDQRSGKISPAAAIRSALSLYSAWFVMDIERSGGEITQITFRGGGWGHGLGMPQWGAAGMAQRGYEYKEILQFYFPGVTFTQK